MSSGIAAVVTYLLMGFIQLKTHAPSAHRYPGWRGIWYTACWFPIEVAEVVSTWTYNLYLSAARGRWELENLVLQSLYDVGPLQAKFLLARVVAGLCGQEPGWLQYRATLRRLIRDELVHKQVHDVPDHLTYYRTEVWYSITGSGIREVHERGLQ